MRGQLRRGRNKHIEGCLAASIVPTPTPSGALNVGDLMELECGPLSAEETDTTSAAIEVLRKLGFSQGQEAWPSAAFGPVLPNVLANLKHAHDALTNLGFTVVEDPSNPLGDGKSWVLKCEPPIELPPGSDPARIAHKHLHRQGVKVAKRPVLDGEILLIPLWNPGTNPIHAKQLEPISDTQRLGDQMADWDQQLRRISKAGRAKRRFSEEDARKMFPEFELWSIIDESNLLPSRRNELFGPSCRSVGDQEGRFALLGELTGLAPATAYDIYKKRSNRKKRARKS